MRLSAPDLYKYFIMFVAAMFLSQSAYYYEDLMDISIIPLMLLTIMVEFVQIPIGNAFGSLTYGVVLGTMILYGPHVAGPLLFVAYVVVAAIQKKTKQASTILFNASQHSTSSYCAYYVYYFFGGVGFTDKLEPSHLLILIPTTLTYIIVNHLMVYVLFYLQKHRFNLRDYWEMSVQDSLTYLIATPFGVFMLAFSKHISAIFLTFLPLVLFGQMLKLYHRITKLNSIHELTSRLQSEFDLDKIYSTIVESVEKMTNGAAAATILWVIHDDRIYPVSMTDPLIADQLPHNGISIEDAGIVAKAVRNKRLEGIDDIWKSKDVKPIRGKAHFESIVVVPLLSRDKVVGVLTCYATRTHAFSPQVREWIKTMAAQVGVIIENANLYRELQEATLRDPGTGLYNYRYFYHELSQRFTKAKEASESLSIMILDIDHFKKYNDTYGHVVGDEVLRQTGQVIQKTVGDKGVVARYGGEEFAVLLDEPLDQAKVMVELIRRTVAHHKFEYQGYVVQGITVSIGLATYPDHDHDEKELLEKADQAMYWGAKQRGRNKVAVYTPEFDAHLFVDQLTGLYTYHYLRIKLTEEFTLGSRETVQPFALIFLNVVDFNNINSTFGFEVGNHVLREISVIVKQNVRNGEIASRYGGDEFLLLIPGVERVEAEKIRDRIVKAISQHPFRVRDNVIIRLMMRSDLVVYPHEVLDDHQLVSIIPETFLHLSSNWAEVQTQDA